METFNKDIVASSGIFTGPESVLKEFKQGKFYICFKEGLKFSRDGKMHYQQIYLDIEPNITNLLEEDHFDFEGVNVFHQIQKILETYPDGIKHVFFTGQNVKTVFKKEELYFIEIEPRKIVSPLSHYIFNWILYGLGIQEKPGKYQSQMGTEVFPRINAQEIADIKQDGMIQRVVLDALENKFSHHSDVSVIALRDNVNEQNVSICIDVQKLGKKHKYLVLSYDADPYEIRPEYKHQFAVIIDTSKYTVNFIDSLQKDRSNDQPLKDLLHKMNQQSSYAYKIVNLNHVSFYAKQTIIGIDRSLCGLYTFKNICNLLERKSIGGQKVQLTDQDITTELTTLLQLSKSIEAKTYLHENLRETYVAHYKFLEILMQDAQYPIRDLYTNLTLITEIIQKRPNSEVKGKGSPLFEFERDTLIESIDQLSKSKHSITLQDIFNPRETVQPKKVLIVGKAGVGKTTLCKKIAYEWADNNLWENKFKSILLVPIRELNESVKTGNRLDPKKFRSKEDWLHEVMMEVCVIRGSKQTYHYRNIIRESFKDYLSRFKSEVLVVFDGYDEATYALKEIMHAMLREEINSGNQIYFIVLSRPGDLQEISNLTDTHVETVGFSEKQTEEYICRFFQVKSAQNSIESGTEKEKSLLQELERNMMVKGMASNPIQLQMLCCLWEDVAKREGLGSSVTHLYQQMIDQFYCWNLTRKCPNVNTFFDDSRNKIAAEVICVALKELQKESLPNNTGILLKSVVEEKFKKYETTNLSSARFIEVLTENGFLKKRFADSNEPIYQFVPTVCRIFLAVHEKNVDINTTLYKQQLFEVMSHLAEVGFRSGQLVMTKEMIEAVLNDYNHVIQIQDLLDSGLLRSTGNSNYPGYMFFHLTFQEYLTAYYLIKQSMDKISIWIQTHKYQPRYQLVLQFMCGLIMHEQGIVAVKNFFALLEQPPRDLMGVYHDTLVARCLNECEDIESLYNWINDSYQIFDRLERKLNLDTYPLSEYECIRSDLSYFPHLYQTRLVDAFISQLGSNERKNETAMKVLLQLGIPKHKKFEIFTRLLKEHYLKSLKSYITSIMDGISQSQADQLVTQLVSRWPARKKTDISVTYTIEIAPHLAKIASPEKKLILVQKLVDMLEQKYECKDAAKAFSEIGVPISEMVITNLLKDASYVAKSEYTEEGFSRECRRKECIEVLGHLNRVIPEHCLNSVFQLLIKAMKEDSHIYYIHIEAIKHIIPTLLEQQRQQVFLTFMEVLSAKKIDEKLLHDFLATCRQYIPINLKPDFIVCCLEHTKEMDLSFLMETVISDSRLADEIMKQTIGKISQMWNVNYKEKEVIELVIKKLSELRLVALFKLLINGLDDHELNNVIEELICQILLAYPKNHISDAFAQLIQSLDNKKHDTVTKLSLIIKNLFEREARSLDERQLLFHRLCDRLEGNSSSKITILKVLGEVKDEKLEEGVSRLLQIRINMLEENIESRNKKLIMLLLDFGGLYKSDANKKNSKSFFSNHHLLTHQQAITLQIILLKLIDKAYSDDGFDFKYLEKGFDQLSELFCIQDSIDREMAIGEFIRFLTHKNWQAKLAAIAALEKIASKLSDKEIKEIMSSIRLCLSDSEKIVVGSAQRTIIKLCTNIKTHEFSQEKLIFSINILAAESEHIYESDKALGLELVANLIDDVSNSQLLQLLDILKPLVSNRQWELQKQAGQVFIKIVKNFLISDSSYFYLLSKTLNLFLPYQIAKKIDDMLEHLLSCCTKAQYREESIYAYGSDSWLLDRSVRTVRDDSIPNFALETLIELIKFLPEEKINFIIKRWIAIVWQKQHLYTGYLNGDAKGAILSLHKLCRRSSPEQQRFIIKALLVDIQPSETTFLEAIKIFKEYQHIVTDDEALLIVEVYFKLLKECYSNKPYGYIGVIAKDMISIISNDSKSAFTQKLITLSEKENQGAIAGLRFVFDSIPTDKVKTAFRTLFKNLSGHELQQVYSNLSSQEGQAIIVNDLKEILAGDFHKKEKLADMLINEDIPEKERIPMISFLLKLPSRYYSNTINEDVVRILEKLSILNLLTVYMLSNQGAQNVEKQLFDIIKEKLLRNKISIIYNRMQEVIAIDIYDKSHKATLQLPSEAQTKLERFLEFINKNLISSQFQYFNALLRKQDMNSLQSTEDALLKQQLSAKETSTITQNLVIEKVSLTVDPEYSMASNQSERSASSSLKAISLMAVRRLSFVANLAENTSPSHNKISIVTSADLPPLEDVSMQPEGERGNQSAQ